MISEPTTLFILFAVLVASLLGLSGWSPTRRLFEVIPVVLFAYFVPALLRTAGVIPGSSTAYDWMTRVLLPLCLVLLMVGVDLRAILRLGPRALVMMLTGSLGIIIGGPVALLVFGSWLPDEAWKGLAALSGSWIGGTANLIAIKESVGTPDSLLGPIIVVDTVVGYGWMVILLLATSWQRRFDAWTGADTTVLEATTRRLAAAGEVRSPTELRDLGLIVGLGFGGAGLAIALADRLPALGDPTIIGRATWAVVIATALGLLLSETRVSKLEQVGASKAGTLTLYLLVTAIGAQADLAAIVEAPAFLAAGVLWIAIHVLLLVVVAKLIRAPLFLVATGSMANVGGAVSAPVVASVYHPALAPVGVLMGVSGYVIGIYGGLLCAWLLAQVGG